MKNLILFTTIFGILSFAAHAENTIGFLDISIDINTDINTNWDGFHDSNLLLLDQPNGNIIGEIHLSGYGYSPSLEFPSLKIANALVNRSEIWSSYKANTIKYYEITDGYARVLANTVDGGAWLKLKHFFPSKNLTVKLIYKPWSARLKNSLWRISGYHNYRLREKPSKKGKILVYLNENRHIVSHGTGNVQGHWSEVVVLEVMPFRVSDLNDPCHTSLSEIKDHLTGNQWKGWLKVLGDNGEPKDIRDDDGPC